MGEPLPKILMHSGSNSFDEFSDNLNLIGDVDTEGNKYWNLPDGILANPLSMSAETAREKAKIIIEFWRDLRIDAELDTQYPLDIVDVGPGSGMSCWLMLNALSFYAGDEFRWRYLPLVSKIEQLEPIIQSRELDVHIKSGLIVPMHWDSGHGILYLLDHQERTPWVVHNPIVVLSHDRFAHMGQRLLAVHYGKLMEAEISSGADLTENELAKDPVPEVKKLHWNVLSKIPIDSSLRSIFDIYIKKFNSSPIPFPFGALKFINDMSNKSPKGCFFIGLAHGLATEKDIRLGDFSENLKEFQDKNTLPVNFHLLDFFYRNSGGLSVTVQLQGKLVLHLAITDSNENTRSRLKKLMSRMNSDSFNHVSSLIEATRALGSAYVPNVRLTLLKLSEFDPAVFLAGCKPLTAALANASQEGRLDKTIWHEVLKRIWANYFPTPGAVKLHQSLAPAAMHCSSWQLAKSMLERGIELFGDSATDVANLAWCENRTGNPEGAVMLTNRALEIEPEHPLALEVKRRVLERLETRDDRWRKTLSDPEAGIFLEPLDYSHADALFHQYRDPQISIMTGLPPVKSRDDVHRWIAEQGQDENKINYAIVLRDEGFAGYINLAISEHAAFFCFWTGVDFQGRGLAAKAGRLAFAHAIKLGVPLFLTSAFQDNYRSLSALRRMGFFELSIRALPPDHERIFFGLSEDNDLIENGVQELLNYYERENLTLQFPPTNTAVSAVNSSFGG